MDIPAAVRRMIDATNAGDNEAFLAAFTDDAHLEDWGHAFDGGAGVATWNDSDNIGRRAHFEVNGVRSEGSGFVVNLAVTGDGFNGVSDFYFEVDGDQIKRMVIRAD